VELLCNDLNEDGHLFERIADTTLAIFISRSPLNSSHQHYIVSTRMRWSCMLAYQKIFFSSADLNQGHLTKICSNWWMKTYSW